MSKQVNHVNIEPDILHGTGLPTGSIMKYNFFVNPFTSCKTDIIISHYNADHTIQCRSWLK